MKRLHLFEFEDQKWFPGILREYVTEILRYANNLVNSYMLSLPLIKEALEHSKDNKIVDLCSGAIGPWDQLYKELVASYGAVALTLTDKYPSNEMCDRHYNDINKGNVTYLTESIDARNIPKHLQGMRTLFSGLHHFREEDVMKILTNAVNENNAIGIFEYTQRKGWAVVGALLSPLFVVCVTPFLRPVTFARFFLTYIIPIIPVVFLWDAIVSCLRSYSLEELEKFTMDLKKEEYVWKVGICAHEYPGLPVELIYLMGYPEKS